MSESFDRGRDTEREVAAVLRKKLGARVLRDPRSGAGLHRADIKDYFQDLPIFIECKDQETLKVKEWMRQTMDAASFNQAPTLVFRMDTELLACVRFTDLVNFLVELADNRAEIEDLRKPIDLSVNNTPIAVKRDAVNIDGKTIVTPVVEQKINRGAQTCRDGHIADQWGYCLQVGCKYSRGYKAPKGKDKKK